MTADKAKADRSETPLFAITEGDATARAPVVFLHGFGGSADVWADVAAAIAVDHPTVAYDLPGHARSLASSGIGGAGRMAKAIAADLDSRGIAGVHLVGHSMGGAVAALLALRDPNRVVSLTLLAPGGFGSEINHRLLQRYAQAADAHAIRLALEEMYGWNRPFSDATVEAYVALRAQPGAIETLLAIHETMTTGTGLDRRQGMIARADLETLTMPVKVLWGKQDRVLPTRQAHRLPPLFAAHVFEDTGHMLIDEQREAVITLVEQSIKTGG
ncbi:alpha/beta fold hydrolase [Rhizobium sp. EC-SD404]|uniref:alpha/beta fold hydrolase n=1 Tax=Rhizobium sp. EC-SD404 TaxID=2038389 RepID=UPI0012574E73|nr:alpha/beta fold hydrolase [Rhizobium sp. EC-SD404]VVT10617.1 Dihydrolipoamide S-acetyltransferase [Rhizobium sp. EC-SD404]